ncbi:MAG: hypothetical protein C5B52_06245 [Bacteroidetes bacterium]|nr:MAG: hypothetical protein C5B52_06245 [Bacteroidota bacterium]
MKKLFIVSLIILFAISCKEGRKTKSSAGSQLNSINAESSNSCGADTALSDANSAATKDQKFIEGVLYPFDKVFILNW